MLKQHDRNLRRLLLATDIGMCAGALALLLYFVAGWSNAPFAELAPHIDWRLGLMGLVASGALPVFIRLLEPQPSSRLESLGSVLRTLISASGTSLMVLAALAFLADVPVAPIFLLTAVTVQVCCVALVRISILQSLRAARRRGRNYRNVLVIGSGPRARELTETILRHPEWGLKIIGYVDEAGYPSDAAIPEERVYKLIDFPMLLRDNVIDEVITACPRAMLAAIEPVVEGCSAAGVPLTVMTDLFGEFMPPPQVKRFAALNALSFAPVHHSRSQLVVKRGIDIAGAAAGLLVSAPLIGIAAAAIKLTSPGPVFFRQTRSGLHGRPFTMLKLRTMVQDAEARQKEIMHLNQMDGPVFKIDRDPRITKVGHILRSFSIDELPQFWNVLRGDMSLVGPRPPLPAEVVQYETCERRRLSMRPGLTCLWQVSGRNEIAFDEWVRLHLQYIDPWSLGSDIKILAQTVPTIVGGTGS